MNTKPSFDAVINVWQTLSEEEKRAIIEEPKLIKKFASRLAVRRLRNTFVTHLSDGQAEVCVRGGNGRSETGARVLVQKWRSLATEYGYTGPVAWKVNKGFIFKKHAPLVGPCYTEFKEKEGGGYFGSENSQTPDAIVFWIPRLIEETKNQNVVEQLRVLGNLRARLGLPSNHLLSFGSDAILSALILAHFKRTGQREPVNGMIVRTDNYFEMEQQQRICLSWRKDKLSGDFMAYDRECLDRIGVFALGVEELGR